MVVQHLLHDLRDSEEGLDACVKLQLFRKWCYIQGCHYKDDKFSLSCENDTASNSKAVNFEQEVPIMAERQTAKILRFRPR